MKLFYIFIIFGIVTTLITLTFELTFALIILIINSLLFGYLILTLFKKLNKSIEQERELFVTGPVVIFKWSASKELKVEYVSKNVFDIFGCLAEEFISKEESYLNYIHHEDIYKVLNEFDLYTKNGVEQFTHTPYRIVTKTKEIKWVFVSIKIIKDENAKVISYFGYVIDITNQKENELKLEKLSKIVEYTGDSVVMTNIDGIVTYVNSAFEKLSLYNSEDAIGSKLNFMKSDLHSQEFYERLWSTILDGKIFRDIFINKKKNGELLYEEKTIAPIKDEKGAIISFVSTAKDITNRILREKELNDIFNLSVNPIGITDLETNFLRINSAYEKLSGYTKNELKKLSCVALSKESEIPAVKKALKEAIEKGFVYDMKKTCISKDNREVPILLSMTLLPNKKELLLIVTDISKEVNLAETLKHQVEIEVKKRMQNEQKYQYLFNSGSDAIFIQHFKDDGYTDNFIEVNDIACEMFGYTKEEFKKLKPQDLVKNHTKESVSKLMKESKNIFEREFITKNGKIIMAEVNAKIFMLNDEPTIFATARDITKRKQQEKILIQQSKMAAMGEMIGNIAHQWRQPLNAIGLILQKIKLANSRGKLTNELIEESNEKAMNLINRLSTTIDDFRNFFKPNRLKESFFISDAIKEALKIVEITLNNNNIKVEVDIKDSIEIVGFANEFAQVIINLLNNSKDAILFKQKKDNYFEGVINITLYKENNTQVIDIVDNGGGVDESVLDKIFEPYFSTKDSSGTGIGLYMSKVIIEDNMKGELKAQNIIENSKRVGLKIYIKVK